MQVPGQVKSVFFCYVIMIGESKRLRVWVLVPVKIFSWIINSKPIESILFKIHFILIPINLIIIAGITSSVIAFYLYHNHLRLLRI